ncbi:hypothetical protein K438DRAFT_1926901 [Mycena galopus ATCC 62051]|nr:hypothetical protein K438DRAFT_1926901 [Mycena galopus ATCC 62051]
MSPASRASRDMSQLADNYGLCCTASPASDAGFIVFPDLSVRTEDSYRLKLSLFEVVGDDGTASLCTRFTLLLPYTNRLPGSLTPAPARNDVRHCKSTPFYVYTAKKNPPLTCSLTDQGVKIRIRNDIRMREARHAGDGAEGEYFGFDLGGEGAGSVRGAGVFAAREFRGGCWAFFDADMVQSLVLSAARGKVEDENGMYSFRLGARRTDFLWWLWGVAEGDGIVIEMPESNKKRIGIEIDGGAPGPCID